MSTETTTPTPKPADTMQPGPDARLILRDYMDAVRPLMQAVSTAISTMQELTVRRMLDVEGLHYEDGWKWNFDTQQWEQYRD